VGAESDSTASAVTARGRRTAAALRRAARDAFAELGYPNSRVEDIVERAGVSHGTFYTHYANKAAVLEALVRGAAEQLEDVLAAPWEGEDLLSTLERVIGEFLAVYAAQADILRAWIEAAAVDEEFASLLSATRGAFVDRVAHNLRPVVTGSGHEPRTVARALVAMVEGSVTDDRQSAHVSDDLVRTLASIWHAGVLAVAAPAEGGQGP
jgi:AcrR family transcriptional regulator